MNRLANAVAGMAIPKKSEAPGATVTPDKETGGAGASRSQQTVQWFGKHDMRVLDAPVPLVTDPGDAVIQVTATCICGSDLHAYSGMMAGFKKHDIVGHEGMGIVVDVGSAVTSIKRGQRVVAAFDLACGRCTPCGRQDYSCCDATNPSTEQEAMYGQRTAGLSGYSHLTGGWDGAQAEFLRVPFADVNLLPVPADAPDENYVLLSDVLPTAWHACELAAVGAGDAVAIWGAGPVGLLAAQCAFARGAARVVLIDREQYRLDFAAEFLPRVETVNFLRAEGGAPGALREKFKDPATGAFVGVDAAIEAVGLHYMTSWADTVQTSLGLETDPSAVLNEIITCTRKGGRIGIVGVYVGFTNHFAIGAWMEKSLTMSGGQTPVQKYWKQLLEMVQDGALTPQRVITHVLPLAEAPRGYKMFNDKTDGCVKVMLRPGGGAAAREQ